MTYDLISLLSIDENAQCVVLVQEKNSGDVVHHAAVPVTLFKADVVTGTQLHLSGRFCPFTIMSFGNLGSATTFIGTHKDNLRFDRCISYNYTLIKITYTGREMGDISLSLETTLISSWL